MAGPLGGIRVADFTWVWAGPFCTLQLAYLGAEVIRVESAHRVCITRRLPPWAGGEEGVNRSGYFNQYNEGKRSVQINLGHPEGVELAKKLVAISDVVAENFAAGVLDRLGLGYEVLREVKRDIVMISMSGYGGTGPERDYVSYGPIQVPLAGLSTLTGYTGLNRPMHVGISYGDPNAGLHGAFALLAALWHRENTGEGQHIDLSQWESLIAVIGDAVVGYSMNGRQPEQIGNRHPRMAPHGIFRCAPAAKNLPEGLLAEDRWVSIVCASDEEWLRLCDVMGRQDLVGDPRFDALASRKANEDLLERVVEEWTSGLDALEVAERLQRVGVAAFPSVANFELAQDPQLLHRGFFVSAKHSEIGVYRHTGIPWEMSRTPCKVSRSAPTLGEDNEYVFGELLGMSQSAIEGLIERGVIL